MNRLKGILQNESGISLLELVVVIVIISVFAVTVLIRIAGLSEAARTAKCKSNQSGLQSAITMYWAIQYEYPEVIDDLAPYMKSGFIPECPSGGAYDLIDRSEIICTYSGH